MMNLIFLIIPCFFQIFINASPEVVQSLMPGTQIFPDGNPFINSVKNNNYGNKLKLNVGKLFLPAKQPEKEAYISALQSNQETKYPEPNNSGFEKIDPLSNDDSIDVNLQASEINENSIKGLPQEEFKFREILTKLSEKFESGVMMSDRESLPPQYSSVLFSVFHTLLCLFFLPASIYALIYSKATPDNYYKISSCGISLMIVIAILINTFRSPAWVVVPLCFIFGSYFYKISDESLSTYCNQKELSIADIKFGWMLNGLAFGLLVSNAIYHDINYFYPQKFGIIGFLTHSNIQATAIYYSFLAVFAFIISYSTTLVHKDPSWIWWPVVSAYGVVATSSYLFNITYMSFVANSYMIAYDPASYFSISSFFNYGIQTNIMGILYFVLIIFGIVQYIRHSDWPCCGVVGDLAHSRTNPTIIQ